MQGTGWKRTWTWRGVEKQALVLDWREGGRRKRRQFTTRQEANLALAALLRRRRSEVYDEITETTFNDFYPIYDRMKRWKSESWRERVRISCEVSLARFHDVALSDITPKMVEDFVAAEAQLPHCSPGRSCAGGGRGGSARVCGLLRMRSRRAAG